jgi:hypothetical protein
MSTDGRTLELAAEDRSAPAAPAAPRRNISLRFNVTLALPKRTVVITFNGLTVDNP